MSSSVSPHDTPTEPNPRSDANILLVLARAFELIREDPEQVERVRIVLFDELADFGHVTEVMVEHRHGEVRRLAATVNGRELGVPLRIRL